MQLISDVKIDRYFDLLPGCDVEDQCSDLLKSSDLYLHQCSVTSRSSGQSWARSESLSTEPSGSNLTISEIFALSGLAILSGSNSELWAGIAPSSLSCGYMRSCNFTDLPANSYKITPGYPFAGIQKNLPCIR